MSNRSKNTQEIGVFQKLESETASAKLSTMTDHTAQEEHEKPNRMARRRLETRSKLLAATLDLVLEKGIDKTTMDDITEAADLGRRTLYYHFASKEECVLAAVAGVYAKHASGAEEHFASVPDPALRVAGHAHEVIAGLVGEPVTQRLVKHPDLLAAALEKSVALFALMDFEQGVADKRFRLSANVDLLYPMLVWALVGLLIKSIEKETKLTEIQSAFAILVLTNLGIPADEARALNGQAARL